MSCNPHIQLVPAEKDDRRVSARARHGRVGKGLRHVREQVPGRQVGLFQFSRFLPHFGSAWLAYLIDTFSLQPGHVFLKDPNVNHIDRFFELFPDAKLLLLVRDGRDNVASSVRAAQAKRRSDTLSPPVEVQVNRLLRRDFLSAATRLVVGRPEDREIRRALPSDSLGRAVPDPAIRRRLPEPEGVGQRIFAFMEVPCDEAILHAVENADVVGSSFYSASEKEDARKPNWIATPKSEAFQPVGRWKAGARGETGLQADCRP